MYFFLSGLCYNKESVYMDSFRKIRPPDNSTGLPDQKE